MRRGCGEEGEKWGEKKTYHQSSTINPRRHASHHNEGGDTTLPMPPHKVVFGHLIMLYASPE